MEQVEHGGFTISSSSETPEQMQLALGDVVTPPAPEAEVPAPEDPPAETIETKPATEEIKPKVDKHSAPERVKRATAEAAQAKREAGEARQQAAALQERLSRLEKPQADTDQEPKEADFESYRDFVKAQSRWEAKQELQAFSDAQREQAQREQVQKQANERAQAFQGKIVEAGGQEFLDKISEDVLNIPAGTPLGIAVRDSEMAPDLMKYLSEHPDELRALSGLHPAHVFRAVGKIEGKLERVAVTGNAPRVQAVSKAKPPVKPVTGMPDIGNDVTDDTPFEEFVTKRRASMVAHSRN